MAHRTFFLVCLIASATGCEGLGREAIIRSAVKECTRAAPTSPEKAALDCNCVVRNSLSDMSFEELSLWSRTPGFFDADDLQVLMIRKAVSCLGPQLIATCMKSGGTDAECSCISSQVLATFSGDELLDISERMRNGAAVPPEAARIRLDCSSRFGIMKTF